MADIYPIFKNNDFKGYALINGDNYRSYSYDDNPKDFSMYYKSSINSIDSYDYVVTEMLGQLNRSDIKENLGLENLEPSLRQKFNSLINGYSKKNYHFKK